MSYSIQEVCDKFVIDRRTLNRRINKLKDLEIEVKSENEMGRVVFSDESLKILEQANEHLKPPGATLNNFVLRTEAQVAPVRSQTVSDLSEEKIYLIVRALGQAVSQAPIQQPKQLTPYERKLELKHCAENNLWLNTKEIKFYTGKQPVSCRTDNQGDRYYPYGNFRFYKTDEQSFWKVVLIN